MAATTLSVRPNRLSHVSSLPRPAVYIPNALKPWRGADTFPCWRTLSRTGPLTQASSRADDPAPSDMSLEIALRLLGVAETASFDEILRAKNSVIAACKANQESIAQVEAAYDMLLMRSLTRRRAGKVLSSSVRYADVKVKTVASSSGGGGVPQWLQTTMKKSQVSVDPPTPTDLGLQVGVYTSLMLLTYVNGTSTSAGGKASLITVGGLLAGAVVGSTVENWLQVDIVPFLRINSPAAVVTEFILLSQLLASLYLR